MYPHNPKGVIFLYLTNAEPHFLKYSFNILNLLKDVNPNWGHRCLKFRCTNSIIKGESHVVL
jgi:hypothetical protein